MAYATDFAHISPTAKLVADLRRFSDIPFAEEIAHRIGATIAVVDIVGREHLDRETLRWMAPLIEARYQSIVQAIRRSGCRQVLEFAAGFSFRGVAMTSEDPGLRYVDTDLPEVHEERGKLLDGLIADGIVKPSPGFVMAPVNMLDERGVAEVARLLEPGQPVAIVSEGVLQYLTHEEKREAAACIRGILESHGGVWLTPDFDSLSQAASGLMSYPQIAAIGAFLAQATRRDVVRNAFKNDAQLRDFLRETGFVAETTPQIDGSYELTSAKRLGPSAGQLEQLRATRKLWWLRPDSLVSS